MINNIVLKNTKYCTLFPSLGSLSKIFLTLPPKKEML